LLKNKRKSKQNKRKTQQHRWALLLELADLNQDCLLEVNLHPEGHVIGQLDQGFPWISLVPEHAEFVSKFHVALHASHVALPMLTLKITPYSNVNFDF
jgi:hypothetical protein